MEFAGVVVWSQIKKFAGVGVGSRILKFAGVGLFPSDSAALVFSHKLFWQLSFFCAKFYRNWLQNKSISSGGRLGPLREGGLRGFLVMPVYFHFNKDHLCQILLKSVH